MLLRWIRFVLNTWGKRSFNAPDVPRCATSPAEEPSSCWRRSLIQAKQEVQQALNARKEQMESALLNERLAAEKN